MHLPFFQIADELVEHAPDLALELDLPEATVGWGLVRLIRWGLSRCPDDAPPSANAVVKGPNAAKLIARAAGVPLELADLFVDACERIRPRPVLERVSDGIRIRGLDRYDEAWANAQGRSAKAKAAADKRWRAAKGDRALTDAQAMPEQCPSKADASNSGCSGDAPRCLDPQPEVDAEVESQKPPPPPAVDDAPRELRVVPDDAPAEHPPEAAAQGSPEEFWDWAQGQRAEVLPDAVRELPPDTYEDWALRVIAEVGTYRLSCAYQAFLLDDDFRRKGCPFRIFMSDKVWRHRAHDPPAPRTRRRL